MGLVASCDCQNMGKNSHRGLAIVALRHQKLLARMLYDLLFYRRELKHAKNGDAHRFPKRRQSGVLCPAPPSDPGCFLSVGPVQQEMVMVFLTGFAPMSVTRGFLLRGSMTRVFALFIFLATLFLPPAVFAQERPGAAPLFLKCDQGSTVSVKESDKDDVLRGHLGAFAKEMAARHGFDERNLNCVLGQARHNSQVVQLMKPPPPGRVRNWQAYRKRHIGAARIEKGVEFWKKYGDALLRAEKLYGVPAEIIVGIIGIETNYGRIMGTFGVLDALATLAFDYPEHPRRQARIDLFRKELENVLLLSAETGADPLSWKGSFAGAIGWPQFLPSSIRAYAVDFDGSGKIDLVNSPVDAIGSVASFLVQHGWKRDVPIVHPAKLASACAKSPAEALNQGLVAGLTPEYLREICVSTRADLPAGQRYGLIDLQNGSRPTEYWLGTENFFAITSYNRSYFYAMSVIGLGQSVNSARSAPVRAAHKAASPAKKRVRKKKRGR